MAKGPITIDGNVPFTITLPGAMWATVQTGLDELPRKHSEPVMQLLTKQIREQVVALQNKNGPNTQPAPGGGILTAPQPISQRQPMGGGTVISNTESYGNQQRQQAAADAGLLTPEE